MGRLAEDRSGVYFQYDDGYLTKRQRSIAPFNRVFNNQLQQAPFLPHYGLHGVFGDSLPDGWGLYLMDRIFRQNGFNPRNVTTLERLAFVGNRGPGALFYEPETHFENQKNKNEIELIQLGKEAVNEFEGTESHFIDYLVNAGGSGGQGRNSM